MSYPRKRTAADPLAEGQVLEGNQVGLDIHTQLSPMPRLFLSRGQPGGASSCAGDQP
jgi:hypothetical protein